jgi:hypothetical protein
MIRCAVVGLLLAVAVAWIHAASLDIYQVGAFAGEGLYQTPGNPSPWWFFMRRCQGGALCTRWIGGWTVLLAWDTPVYRNPPPFWTGLRSPPAPSDVLAWVEHVSEARGWPVVCLYSRRDLYMDFDNAMRKVTVEQGIALPWPQQSGQRAAGPGVFEPRVLPLHPIWSGLLIDSGVYGLAAFAAVTVPGHLRRRGRRRRGLCVECGYDLRGTTGAICPECGESRGHR